jgi:hypothetical protein
MTEQIVNTVAEAVPVIVISGTVVSSGTAVVTGTVQIVNTVDEPVPITGTVSVSGTIPVSGTVAISGAVPVTVPAGVAIEPNPGNSSNTTVLAMQNLANEYGITWTWNAPATGANTGTFIVSVVTLPASATFQVHATVTSTGTVFNLDNYIAVVISVADVAASFLGSAISAGVCSLTYPANATRGPAMMCSAADVSATALTPPQVFDFVVNTGTAPQLVSLSTNSWIAVGSTGQLSVRATFHRLA